MQQLNFTKGKEDGSVQYGLGLGDQLPWCFLEVATSSDMMQQLSQRVHVHSYYGIRVPKPY